MENLTLNLQSPRAFKARYASRLRIKNKAIRALLLIIILVLTSLGGTLLLNDSSWGWLMFVPLSILLVLRFWYLGELQDLKLADDSIDGLLDQEVLAQLKEPNPSAYQIWQAVSRSEARYFFQNRFILPPDIFEQFLSKEPASAAVVWQQAAQLQSKYQTTGYPASVVLVALLKTIPDVNNLLNKIKLEIETLEQGIGWLEDVYAKRRLAAEKKAFGGLARDWAYGYAPTLRFLGKNITEEIQNYGFFIDSSAHRQIVEQMAKSMGSNIRSITLVGDIGVGKTTVVHAFANNLISNESLPASIRYNQVISLDAPDLVAQAGSPGQLERLVSRIFNEAQKAKNIILFFDDAQVFFGQGTGSVDLSNLILPVLESGAVRMIFAVTPKEWQTIGANNSSLASKFQPLQVRPTDREETLHILRDSILGVEYQNKVLFTHQALEEAYSLAKRYIDTQEMPGAALSLLKSAAPLATDGYITAEIVKQSIESTTGVKLQTAAGQESDKLLNLEDELHKYVINQTQAVKVIANALRRSRSGVGNPDRPVGTFLFLGPTGVGKTELSKALARVYFGDDKSIIRVDMNQFVSPEDVNRLITPMLGEQLGFLGQVKRQPFSVILLDEIEKAHRNVVNLLLQMLDEGVMRDVDNKPVSFKDAIIIATSNAGADEIRRLISEGQDVVKLQDTLVNTIIERGIFAPEFVNRFDEVVVFRPLNQQELVQVIDLIIAGINKTLDTQKVQVELTQPAKEWLVAKGYDAKLGARPMRRVVQRYVENILAKRLLSRTAGSGSKISLDVKDFEEISEE